MNRLDVFDQKMLELLKLDGRASVTTLASKLNVARATAKSRMEQLISRGVIKRFTVEIEEKWNQDMVSAVMMMELDGAKEKAVIRQLRKIPALSSLHTTNGRWGLIAQLETHNLSEFDQTIRMVQAISGVINSETCLLLDHAPD
jgi:DNA-binding Lrp family transcriptional regulator